MKINPALLSKILDWCYAKALSGGGPFLSAEALAREHLAKGGSALPAARRMIQWQVAKCATSGFVTGLGGVVVLPAAVPANLSSVLLLQLRMVMAVAHLGGYNPRQEEVKTLILACLTAGDALALLRTVGVLPEKSTTTAVLPHLNEQAVQRVRHQIQARLLAQSGRLGLLKLGKAVPLFGGVVGATLDATATREIGKAACRVFLKAD